jgi:hypothetical protein
MGENSCVWLRGQDLSSDECATLEALTLRLETAEATVARLRGVLTQVRQEIIWTREYVEPKVALPAIAGWSWFDAVSRIDAALADAPKATQGPDEWTAMHMLPTRCDNCGKWMQIVRPGKWQCDCEAPKGE